jgi:hypothetical protein
MAKKYDGIAASTLALTQVASVNVISPESASSILPLTGAAEVQHKIKTSGSTLSLSQEASTNTILLLNASNILVLTQSAIRQGTLYSTLENELDLIQSAHCSLIVRSLEHELEFTQDLTLGQPIYVGAINSLIGSYEAIDTDNIFDVDINDPDALNEYLNELGLRHEVTVRKSIYHLTATSYLSLSHQAAPTQFLSASNHLHLSHVVETVLYEEVISYLDLEQEAICHKVFWAEQTLELEQTVDFDIISVQIASNTLNLSSVVSYLVIDFCNYTPGVGDGTFDYTAPSVVSPTLVPRSTTILTWPYSSPTLTIEVRNPNFDNTEQFEFRRINRRTKGGELDLYRDETWPKVERLQMSFTWLSETQRNELFNFLQKSIGQEIGLLDFESRQWRGFIITPTSAISEPKRNGHALSLEFEGELA